MSAALFPLGSCVATPGEIRALTEEGGDWRMRAAVYLARHQDGDWGDVPPEDAHENALPIREGFRIVSSYITGGNGEGPGTTFWIITGADRSSTCILLLEEC